MMPNTRASNLVLQCVVCVLYMVSTPVLMFKLTSTPSQLSPYNDESFQLDCVSSDSTSDIVKASEIRITKQNVELRRWEDIARLTTTQVIKNPDHGDFLVSGNIGDTPQATSLSVVWPKATPTNAGVYRCDLTGTDSWNSYAIEKTNVVTVSRLEPTTPPTTAAPTRAKIIARTQAQVDALEIEYQNYVQETNNQIAAFMSALKTMDDAMKDLETPVDCTVTPDLERQFKEQAENKTMALLSDQLDSIIYNHMDTCGCDVSNNIVQ